MGRCSSWKTRYHMEIASIHLQSTFRWCISSHRMWPIALFESQKLLKRLPSHELLNFRSSRDVQDLQQENTRRVRLLYLDEPIGRIITSHRPHQTRRSFILKKKNKRVKGQHIIEQCKYTGQKWITMTEFQGEF